jgi:hypothetical protein
MKDTMASVSDAQLSGVPTGTNAWQRDYTLCTCSRNWDDCPHCGVSGVDSHHRGRCHARSMD